MNSPDPNATPPPAVPRARPVTAVPVARGLDLAACECPSGVLYGLAQSPFRAVLEIGAVAVVVGSGVLILGALVQLPDIAAEWSTAVGVALTEQTIGRLEAISNRVQDNLVWANVLVNALIVCGVAAVVMRLAGQSAVHFGLQAPRWRRELMWGAALVVPAYAVTACVSMIMALLLTQMTDTSIENMVEGKQEMITAVGQMSWWAVLPVAVLVGVYEELLFRGFLMGRLSVILHNRWWAAIASSLLFGLVHVPSQGWVGLVQTAMLGMMLATIALWRRNIWAAIWCHAGIDTLGFTLTLLVSRFYPEAFST